MLAKVAAARDGTSKGLQQARKCVTQYGRSSSTFIRFEDGRSCDVLFNPIALSDQMVKGLLVEIRVRSGPAPAAGPEIKALQEDNPLFQNPVLGRPKV